MLTENDEATHWPSRQCIQKVPRLGSVWAECSAPTGVGRSPASLEDA